MSNITFTMLKPDSIRNGNTGAILDKIVKSGFKIKAMKFTKMTDEKASSFYSIHSERPFFKDLVGYMTSGPIIAAILPAAIESAPKPAPTERSSTISNGAGNAPALNKTAKSDAS